MSDNYKFVERAESELYSIKVLQGDYSDIVYTYGKVQIIEDKENDRARLKFDFKIEDVPENHNKDDLMEDIKFKNEIGDILSDILSEGKIGNAGSTDNNIEVTNEE